MKKLLLPALVLSILTVAGGAPVRATAVGAQSAAVSDASRGRYFVDIVIPANLELVSADVPVGPGKLTSVASFAAVNGVATADVETFVVASSGFAVRGSETGSIETLMAQSGTLRVTARKKKPMAGIVRVVVTITLN